MSPTWVKVACAAHFVTGAAALALQRSPATLNGAVAQSTQNTRVAVDVDAEFDTFVNSWFDDFMARRPMDALSFGRRLDGCGIDGHGGANPWGNSTNAGEAEGVRLDEERLAEMERRFGTSIGARDASDERHVTVLVLRNKVAEMRTEHEHGDFRLPFGSLGCKVSLMGCQARVPGLLRGLPMDTEQDARCFVHLLRGLPEYLEGHTARLRAAAARGAVPYRDVLEGIRADCNEIVPPAQWLGLVEPDPRDHDLYTDFGKRLAGAKQIPKEAIDHLKRDAAEAVRGALWPAYRNLRTLVEELLTKAPSGDYGISHTYGHPGQEAYAERLRLLGVGLDAPALHERALALVAENQQAMRNIAAEGVPEGERLAPAAPFSEVLLQLRKHFYDEHFPNDESGRAAYLAEIEALMQEMWARLDAPRAGGALFAKKDVPTLPCHVERIQSPSFPASAQYRQGSLGEVERPASVAFKVSDMTTLPKAEMQVLAYHEGVPGHHLQVTRTLELRDKLPGFRRFFGDEAFSEGWAVYAEQDISRRLVELGASAKLGFLNYLQLRAVRTVVDTGFHHFDWNRARAKKFYLESCIITEAQAEKFIVRHLAWPGQQLSYLAGYQHVRDVRRAALIWPDVGMESLGDDWEAAFHGALVSHGDLPLAIVKDVVRADLALHLRQLQSPANTSSA